MRGRKGYTLIELMAVLVILLLVVLLTATAVVGEIDKARGHTLTAQAHLVYVAAQAAMLESKALYKDISDYDCMAGLTGTVNDTSRPEQAKLSHRMRELLEPDIVLAAEAGENAAKAAFEVKNGVIVSMTYEALAYGRYYLVTISGGETTVTRVEKDME